MSGCGSPRGCSETFSDRFERLHRGGRCALRQRGNPWQKRRHPQGGLDRRCWGCPASALWNNRVGHDGFADGVVASKRRKLRLTSRWNWSFGSNRWAVWRLLCWNRRGVGRFRHSRRRLGHCEARRFLVRGSGQSGSRMSQLLQFRLQVVHPPVEFLDLVAGGDGTRNQPNASQKHGQNKYFHIFEHHNNATRCAFVN